MLPVPFAADFDLTIKVSALDARGQSVWNREFTGHGHTEKNRSLVDLPPATEAAHQVFEQLRTALLNDPAFQGASLN